MAWDIPVSVVPYQTPDIKTIVQEIVNRSGWASGNSMSFVITGSGDRRAYAVDGSGYYAPLLHVEFGSGQSIDVKVYGYTDDAVENNSSNVDMDNDYLDLGNGDTNKYNGMRFINLQIPQGATITNAYIKFSSYYTRTTTTNLTIKGHASDNSPTFANTTAGRLSTRYTTYSTSASVSWNSVSSWTGPTLQPRMNIAKEALNELVEDKTISWGFGTWHSGYPSGDNYTKLNVGCRYNTPAHLLNLQAGINSATPGSNTPLTPALNAGLDYFKGIRPDLKYNERFVGTECQPTFVIVITDGMGNLNTTVTNIGTSTQALETQGVNTVGIGFGLPLVDAEQLFKLAEVSNNNGKQFPKDSLYALHKEVNGVPQPFLAQSKETLLEALKSITASIKAEVFHGRPLP
jgi:hypothetical protein